MVANALPHAHVVLFDPPTNRRIPSLRPQYLKCAGFADTRVEKADFVVPACK